VRLPARPSLAARAATADATATTGSDYLAETGTVTFLAGESTRTITIKVYGDPNDEPDETFHVTLTGITSGPGELGVSSADGLIVNDDVTAVASISNATVPEGNTGTKNIVFTRDAVTARDRCGQARLHHHRRALHTASPMTVVGFVGGCHVLIAVSC
jgi:hypothetical protein